MLCISYNLITLQHFRLHVLPQFKCVCHLQHKECAIFFLLVVLDIGSTVDLTETAKGYASLRKTLHKVLSQFLDLQLLYEDPFFKNKLVCSALFAQ